MMLVSRIQQVRVVLLGRAKEKLRSFAKQYSTAPPKEPKDGLDWDKMTFSLTPTNKMYVAYSDGRIAFNKKGSIVPFGNISISPAATMLNYGQSIFEGIKAFRTTKGRICVFRHDENWKRMNEGAARFIMPQIDKDVWYDGINKVVIENSEFVPPVGRGALYLRPLLFGSGAALGVAPSTEYTWIVFASPVGSYFKTGKLTPINLLLSVNTHRAAPKGSGGVKAAGNYAPVFAEQKQAKEKGFHEVLFLDAKHEKHIEEAGASNVFVVGQDNTIYTPELGAILPGITRKSVIHLLREKGYKVKEEKVDVDLLLGAKEAFCTGTGASITPIGSVTKHDKKYVLNNGQVGTITQEIYDALLDIQLERVPDKYGWLQDPWQQ